MSELANTDWRTDALGAIAEPRRGITYTSAMLEGEDGGLPYINMKSFRKGGGFNDHGTKRYAGFFLPADLVGDQDLLIANTDVTLDGDIVGSPALLPSDMMTGQVLYSHHVTRLRLNGKVTVPFLYYLLCLPEYRQWMLKFARGTTVVMLDMQALKRIPIRYPKGQRQQDHITEVLSAVDKTIEQTEALIAKYQQIKAGLTRDLFTRGVGPDGQLRPARAQAPHVYRESPLGWIPKEWEVARLRDKSHPGRPHIKTGPFGSSLKGEHWVEHGHPVITIGALGEGELLAEGLLFVSEATAQRLHEYQLEPGDVVFSRVADVGRSAVICAQHDGWIMSSNLMRISLDRNLVAPSYLQSQFAFDFKVKSQIRTKVNSGGRDVANGQILNQLLFAWPRRDEQEIAMQRITTVDANRRGLADQRTKLVKLKHGLMRDLLTGRVRVEVAEPGFIEAAKGKFDSHPALKR